MKLSKLLDASNVQCYRIVSPDTFTKKHFKHKYLVGLLTRGGPISCACDFIPSEFYQPAAVGYIFTTENSIPPVFTIRDPTENLYIGKTFPTCLDDLYTDCDKHENIIIQCGWSTGVNDPIVTDDVFVKARIDKLLVNNPSQLRSMLEHNLERKFLADAKWKTLYDWMLSICENVPVNSVTGLPLRFPKTINESMLKPKHVNLSNMFIGYDIRPTSYDEESNIVRLIESAFEDISHTVRVYDTYNGLKDKVVRELKAKKLKHKVFDDYVETTLKNVRKLKIEYDLTDFV